MSYAAHLLVFGAHFVVPGFLLALPVLLPFYPAQPPAWERAARGVQLGLFILCRSRRYDRPKLVVAVGLGGWLACGLGAMYTAGRPDLFLVCLALHGPASAFAFWPLARHTPAWVGAGGTATGAVLFSLVLAGPAWPAACVYVLPVCAGALLAQLAFATLPPEEARKEEGCPRNPSAHVATALHAGLLLLLLSFAPTGEALSIAAGCLAAGWVAGSALPVQAGQVVQKLCVVLAGIAGAGRGLMTTAELQLWWHALLGLLAGLGGSTAYCTPHTPLLVGPVALVLLVVVVPEWALPASLVLSCSAFPLLFAGEEEEGGGDAELGTPS